MYLTNNYNDYLNLFKSTDNYYQLDNFESSYSFDLIEYTDWDMNFLIKNSLNYSQFYFSFYCNDFKTFDVSGSTTNLLYYSNFSNEITTDWQSPIGFEYTGNTMVVKSGNTASGLYINPEFLGNITANTEYTIGIKVEQLGSSLTFTNFGTLTPISISGTGIFTITLTGSSNSNNNRFILTQDLSGSTDTIISWIKVVEGVKPITDEVYYPNDYVEFDDLGNVRIRLDRNITKNFIPGHLVLNVVLTKTGLSEEKNILLGRVFKSLSKRF